MKPIPPRDRGACLSEKIFKFALLVSCIVLWALPQFRVHLTFGDGSVDSGWVKPLLLLVIYVAAVWLYGFIHQRVENRNRS